MLCTLNLKIPIDPYTILQILQRIIKKIDVLGYYYAWNI